jgi:site-specific DNA-cytosine methylase
MIGTHISLFAGVGMTDLAAEALGFTTLATAEIDPWCRSLLAKRFPDATHFEDVRHVTAQSPHTLARPLLISGGFPCQGISAIGDGKGMKDPRSGLWREFARVIYQFRPDLVLIENSPMLRTRGLDRILGDLYGIQYDARWDCIPAASVGAPHLRDRIFIVAWPRKAVLNHEPDRCLGYVSSLGVHSRQGVQLVKRLPRAGEMRDGYVVKGTPRAPIKAAKSACLAHAVACPATPTGAWPTPAASLPQDYEQPDTWLARREKLLAKGISGNGAGMPLSIAVKLYPTPRRASNDWRTTRNAPTHGTSHGKTLAGEVNDQERAEGRMPASSSESAGNVNPMWVEWLMGLPLGWTDPAVDNNQLVPHPGWSEEPRGVPRTIHPQEHRKCRLMALGNGLVPQAAVAAFQLLQ